MIEARRSGVDLNKYIDITIDDLKFLNCAPTLPTEGVCAGSQFTCANKVCELNFKI